MNYKLSFLSFVVAVLMSASLHARIGAGSFPLELILKETLTCDVSDEQLKSVVSWPSIEQISLELREDLWMAEASDGAPCYPVDDFCKKLIANRINQPDVLQQLNKKVSSFCPSGIDSEKLTELVEVKYADSEAPLCFFFAGTTRVKKDKLCKEDGEFLTCKKEPVYFVKGLALCPAGSLDINVFDNDSENFSCILNEDQLKINGANLCMNSTRLEEERKNGFELESILIEK